MKIRFLLNDVSGSGGGVLQVVLSLAGDLAERHDVELVSVLRKWVEPTHELPAGVRVRNVVDKRHGSNSLGRFRTWAHSQPSRLMLPDDPRYRQHNLYSDIQLARYLRSVRDGVVIGMQPSINVAIARLARKSTVRIAQEHRPFTSRSTGFREASMRYYPRLDLFLTLTERDARKYREAFAGRVPVEAMPNGTPTFGGTPSNQQSKVVVAAGRLKKSKGFDRLLRAWAIVSERYPDWQLRIFGEGAQRPALEDQVTELGIGESARLMGYTSSLGQEMAASSIFVLSSRSEGYPMVLLEAMSCGLPVVSFDCRTGPREIITPEHDGFLVPNNNVDALADAISRMIELGDERLGMRDAALETARQRSQAAVTARWEAILTEQLAAKQGRKRSPG